MRSRMLLTYLDGQENRIYRLEVATAHRICAAGCGGVGVHARIGVWLHDAAGRLLLHLLLRGRLLLLLLLHLLLRSRLLLRLLLLLHLQVLHLHRHLLRLHLLRRQLLLLDL